jgi:tRNA dimethylallyltransferase
VSRLAIVGPTATGKTALAVALARADPSFELISADAIAVYRGLDIGTAKPTAGERRGVVWHLLDVVGPGEEFSVAQFQSRARSAVAGIEARGHVPVLVGGTGLYQRAVVDELDIPPRFPDLRAVLEADAARDLAASYAQLCALDPAAAEKMTAQNLRRIVRALEVTIGTGRPFSSFGPGLGRYAETSWSIVGLTRSRDDLAASIAARLEHQLAAGLIDETAQLLARPGGLSRTARQALGYRELIEHLGGRRRLDATRAEIVQRTRSFARRQLAWFRRDPRIRWFDARTDDLAAAVRALDRRGAGVAQ